MKRREFITATGAVIATAPLAAGAIAQPAIEQRNASPETSQAPAPDTRQEPAAPAVVSSMPAVRWRCTSSFPRALDTIFGSSEFFSKAVSDATDGKFHIDVFASNEIVPGLQAADAVTNGTVEMAHTASYYYVGKDPTFALFTAAPFGLNSRMQSAWMRFGQGLEMANDFYKKFNIHAMPAGNTGGQMGGWFRKEIKQVSDLSGLKFRVAGFAGRILGKLGVVPQQLAGGEIYSALEKGTIDAAEWVGPYDDEKLGLQKVAPYYYYPGWWEGGAMLHNFINVDKWNELPKSYQTILRSASAEQHEWMQSKYDAANPAALKRLVGNGAQLRAFSQPVLEACFKSANEVYADISAGNAEFKKVYDNLVAFRGDEYLWWQIGEYTFDNFMIRARSRG